MISNIPQQLLEYEIQVKECDLSILKELRDLRAETSKLTALEDRVARAVQILNQKPSEAELADEAAFMSRKLGRLRHYLEDKA